VRLFLVTCGCGSVPFLGGEHFPVDFAPERLAVFDDLDDRVGAARQRVLDDPEGSFLGKSMVGGAYCSQTRVSVVTGMERSTISKPSRRRTSACPAQNVEEPICPGTS